MHRIEELWIDYELVCRSCNYVKAWNYAIEMAEINKIDLLSELRGIYDLCKIEDYEGQNTQIQQATYLLIDECETRLRKGMPLLTKGLKERDVNEATFRIDEDVAGVFVAKKL